MRATISSHVIPALVTLTVAAPCRAQVLEVTPFAGIYMPQGSSLFTIQGICAPTGDLCGDFGVIQHTGPAVGARVTGWMSKRFALDLSLAYSHSQVERPEVPGGVDPIFGQTEPSDITRGSVGLLVLVTPPRPNALYVVGGWSFVAHGGTAYHGAFAPGQTDWGPLFGVGARFAIGPALALRTELEAQFYTFTGPETFPSSSSQNDLVLSLGLSAKLGGDAHPR